MDVSIYFGRLEYGDEVRLVGEPEFVESRSTYLGKDWAVDNVGGTLIISRYVLGSVEMQVKLNWDQSGGAGAVACRIGGEKFQHRSQIA